MYRRHFLKYGTLAASSFVVASCVTDKNSNPQIQTSPITSPITSSVATREPLKVGFVYVGSISDFGWTYGHDLGRREMEANLQDQVKTTFIENVKTEVEAEKVIRQLALDGNKLIFTTAWNFIKPTLQVAKDFSQVIFENCTGNQKAANVGTYLGRLEEPRYLTGMIAGKMTKSNIIGFIGAYPIPEVIRGINAFTLGIKSTNPQAKVKLIWVKSWYDVAKEKEAAQALINLGADILTQHTDSSSVVQLAEEKGIYVIGYNTDMSKLAPKANLTSAINQWGKFYTDQALAVMNGTWKSKNIWYGISQGMVDISPLNQVIPSEVQTLVNIQREAFIQGTSHPFTGLIKNQKGVIKVPKGQVLDDQGQLKMDWYVEGIEIKN